MNYQIFHPSNWCTDICKTIFETLKLQFHHEAGLVQQRYFDLFFSALVNIFILQDQPRTRPASPFLYICCNFGQIFCTNVIQFFSVENMGQNQLRKCSKYHLVSLLEEYQNLIIHLNIHLIIPLTT